MMRGRPIASLVSDGAPVSGREDGVWFPGPRPWPRWRKARAEVLQGLRRARVVVQSDSTGRGVGALGAGTLVRGLSFPSALARGFPEAYRASDQNYFNGHHLAQAATDDPRLTVGAGWSVGAIDSIGGKAMRTTGTEPLTFVPTAPWRVADLWLFSDGAPSEIVAAAGAAETTIPIPVGGLRRVRIEAPEIGAHALTIRRTAGNPQVAGWDCHDGRPGVSIVNASRAGWWANNILAVAGDLPAMEPDLVILMIGINDWNAGTKTPAQYEADLRALITQTLVSCDMALVAPATPSGVKPYPWSAFMDVLHALAREFDIPILDLGVVMGPYADALSAGLRADATHPNAAGYGRAAESAVDFLMF